MKKTLAIAIMTLVLAAVPAAQALEIDPNVMPEVNLGGRVIATVNANRAKDAAGSRDGDEHMDFSDSSLLLGFSKYLFDSRRYGFAVIGFKIPEDGTDLKDDIYFHELHAGVGGASWEAKLGRSRLGNALISFPTLREEDLLAYTHVGNGSSNAEAEEYQLFGNVIAGNWWFTKALSVDAGITGRTVTDVAGARTSGDQLNGAYLGLAYDLPESIKVGRGVRYAGLRFDTQEAQEIDAMLPKDRMNALIGALVVNLSGNPESTWVLDLQAIMNHGASVTDLASEAARARAKATSVATSIRYGYRPALQTHWQVALTLAWKDYPDFSDATAWAIVPSLAYRLGSGVDFLAQYRYSDYDSTLAAALDRKSEQMVWLGLQFALDATFNETVGERKSILNLEHNMLDIGPMGGGH